ncbi:hypothetical protein DQW77_07090 [Roseovarius sp. TE539]|uniref:phosphate/phosphite/phosphonate ABC transporter substrate-binding protein n=1 Tax=Roseovarius sp. TE539 TaxID=2249812 RepID=UPI000DDE0095|nr:PhnD/SsuA/transferrin family substrate-binding protein [Roseovarius sp. TE539]RBI74692.1 hypothetical protein DQW77_07090 [Roseovarius sp. TE539]
MIALLPMYDRPETRAANDSLWQEVRNRLGYGPEKLSRGTGLWDAWQSRDLVLAQTCGYPYRARLHGKVMLVATPVHDLSECPAGHYFSVFVVRRGDPRQNLRDFADAVLAYNNALSQSGWAAPQNHARGLGFGFSNTLETGGHVESAQAVAEGRADIAALDVVTWTLAQRHDAFCADLRVIDRTAPTPALPFITAPGNRADTIRTALGDAIGALSPIHRKSLCLHGIVDIPAARYLEVPTPPAP